MAALRGCTLVVHLAAVMHGDSETQYMNTMQAARNLLKAMDDAHVSCLIGLSSISVLNYIDQAPLSLIDEETPINRQDSTMGTYALMKRDQEKLFEDWGENGAKKLAIVRPGIVYDDKSLSTAHAGFIKGKIGLAATHNGKVPLVYVKAVAQAIVMLTRMDFQHEVIQLVNNDLPTQSEYLLALKKVKTANACNRLIFRIPWKMYARIASFIRFALRVIGLSNKVPDSFRESSVAARLKPLIFGNAYAKEYLGWKPGKSICTDSGFFSKG
jgi:nucleoside-diphosphate-sugar epimerase